MRGFFPCFQVVFWCFFEVCLIILAFLSLAFLVVNQLTLFGSVGKRPKNFAGKQGWFAFFDRWEANEAVCFTVGGVF